MNFLSLISFFFFTLLSLVFLLPHAASAAHYSACGFSSDSNFRTWSSSIDSDIPLLLPSTEAELASILHTAARHDCRVRVRGAGLSTNGVVAQLQEPRVVAVSLASLAAAPGWEEGVDAATGVATIGAGRSLLELMAMARPLGWLSANQKAGYAGSLGGLVSGTVVGSTVGGGFLYDDVVAVRVMHGDGTTEDVSDPQLLPLYRGAFGLTGALLSLRLQLRPDLGTAAQVLDYHYPMASQDPAVAAAWAAQFAADQQALFAAHSHVHCFLNPWPDQASLLSHVRCLVAAPTGEPFPDAARPEWSAQRAAQLRAVYAGMATNPALQGQATRGVDLFALDLCDPLFLGPALCQDRVACAYGLSTIAMLNLQTYYGASQSVASNGPEDLYWANQATPFQETSYFVPQAQFPAVLGFFLRTYLPFVVLGDASTFLPCGSLSWRLVVPRGASAFEYLQPGLPYFALDLLQLHAAHPADKYAQLATPDVFALFEAAFAALGGRPHLGKGWGYNTTQDWFFGQHFVPFQQPSAPLYTADQIAAIAPHVEPIFAAGAQAAPFLQGAQAAPFEPRVLDGRSCADFGYLDCVSDECSEKTLLCVHSAAAPLSLPIFLLSALLITSILSFVF